MLDAIEVSLRAESGPGPISSPTPTFPARGVRTSTGGGRKSISSDATGATPLSAHDTWRNVDDNMHLRTPVKPVHIYQPQTATQPFEISPLPFFSPTPGNVPTVSNDDLIDILDRIDNVIKNDTLAPPSLQLLSPTDTS